MPYLEEHPAYYFIKKGTRCRGIRDVLKSTA